MMRIRGCRVTEELLEAWSPRLVFDPEPIYVTQAARGALPDEALVFHRKEQRFALDFADAYTTYHVAPEATEVALLSSVQLRALPAADRQALLALQWRLGRGQIYDLASHPAASQGEPFETPEGPKAALYADTWATLAPAARREWLAAYVEAKGQPCLGAERVPAGHNPAVYELAGTFAAASGPNCFATALAAATVSPEAARVVAGVWLTQEPFLRGLAERGFAGERWTGGAGAAPACAVMVWANEAGLPQHAVYTLGGGLCLNKDSQAWWSPRQVDRLETVVAEWADDAPVVSLYHRT